MDSLAYISEKFFQTEVFSQETGKSCCHSSQTPTRILSKDDFFKKKCLFLSGFYTLLEQSAFSITCSISAFQVYSVILKTGSTPFLINYF